MVNKNHVEDIEDEDDRDEDEIEESDESSIEAEDKEKEPEEIEIVDDNRIAAQEKSGGKQESLEEKRERRREEKRIKKERRFAAERRDKQLIQRLLKENQEMKKRVDEVVAKVPAFEQRIQSQDELQLDNAISSQKSLYDTALQHFNKAVTEGNGPAAAEAQRIMDDAKGKYSQLTALKQNIETQKRTSSTQQTQQQKQIDPRHQTYMQRWVTKNDWYDPEGGDEDSVRAKEIDNQIAAEGYTPNTKEYWDELDARLKEEGIGQHRQGSKPTNGSTKPRQVNGSVGADSMSGGGGKKLQIPAATVEMAKDAGLWDDPAKRKRFIENWKEQNGYAG